MLACLLFNSQRQISPKRLNGFVSSRELGAALEAAEVA
jgi:hypothetical protein